jgi:hypothetical protein
MGDDTPKKPQLVEEMKKMEYEPLLPIEKSLIRWSLIIGVGSLVILYFVAHWLFPTI